MMLLKRPLEDELKKLKALIIKQLHVKKMSVSDLARLTGIQQSTLHRAIFSDREVYYSNIRAICKVLEIEQKIHFAETKWPSLPILSRIEDIELNDKMSLSPLNWDEWIVLEDFPYSNGIALGNTHLLVEGFPRSSVLVFTRSEAKNSTINAFMVDQKINFSQGDYWLGNLVRVVFRE